MKQGFQLRDVFNPGVVNQLAQNIARTWPEFDHAGFSAAINARLGSLSDKLQDVLVDYVIHQLSLRARPHDDPTHPHAVSLQRLGECAHPRCSRATDFTTTPRAGRRQLRFYTRHARAHDGRAVLWLSRWQRVSPPSLPDVRDFPDLDAIHLRWDDIERDTQAYIAGLDEGKLARQVAYVNFQGEQWAYPLWQQLIHQVNHATRHRSEVAVMLTVYGCSPGWLDFLYFLDVQNASNGRSCGHLYLTRHLQRAV
jgi:hypothetical protein